MLKKSNALKINLIKYNELIDSQEKAKNNTVNLKKGKTAEHQVICLDNLKALKIDCIFYFECETIKGTFSCCSHNNHNEKSKSGA